MKTLIAPNGMKVMFSDSDEREVLRVIKKAEGQYNTRAAKREEKQKEYFLRVRARYEAWEAKRNKGNTEEPEVVEIPEVLEVSEETVPDNIEAV